MPYLLSHTIHKVILMILILDLNLFIQLNTIFNYFNDFKN